MKWIKWPIRWMKVLPFVAVSGSMIYAALTQWCGHWAWVEAITAYRLLVLVLCITGTILFLIGLSLGRVILGIMVAIWLVWPVVPYFLPERGPEPTGDVSAGPVLTIAVIHIDPDGESTALLEKILGANADLVIAGGVGNRFYQDSFQAARERYPVHWINTPDGNTPGLWCFTRLELERDLSRTRTREAGEPSCDWTLKLTDGSLFRLATTMPPGPWRAADFPSRRQALLAIADAAGAHEGPRIVAGALGAHPFSDLFDEVLANGRLRDSGKGHGFQSTWMPVPPFGLPLDHVLVSDHWQVLDRQVQSIEGSGNRLLVTKLRRVR
ncbi:MAG: endonuclease/exonuclease/phosphatase family protein [Verrucomicrobiales bacterium]